MKQTEQTINRINNLIREVRAESMALPPVSKRVDTLMHLHLLLEQFKVKLRSI